MGLPGTMADLERERFVIALQDAPLVGSAKADPIRTFLGGEEEGPTWVYEFSQNGHFDLPASPHAKQLEFLHESEKRHRWLFWANQSGKTTIGAIDCALLALGRHPVQKWEPPVLIWASALTWDLWESVLLPELLTWLPPERVVEAPEPFQPGRKRVIRVLADNGSVSRIEGKSAEQGRGKYQSRRVHRVWFDEEHPESIYDEVHPRLVRFGGDIIATMTPLLGLTYVYDRVYVPTRDGTDEGQDHWYSHAGLDDNPSISDEDREAVIRAFQGNPAQLLARTQGKFAQPSGIALRFEPRRNLQDWNDDSIRAALSRRGGARAWGGIDFGDWRFGFVLGLQDSAGRMHVVEEYFSQRESLDTRARWIHDRLTELEVPTNIKILGDAANPTDIREINLAFKRIGSKYRVQAVLQENKARAVSVTRVNNLLARGALLLRRDLGAHHVWYLGASSSRDGRKQMGSRLRYEIRSWAYPEPKDGEAQKQDPDDNTADGADLIAALRYMVMTWLNPPKPEKKQKVRRNQDTYYEKLIAEIQRQQQRGARG